MAPWPSYVINLAENTRRMETSSRQLEAAGLPWRRLEGVNGWAMDDSALAKVYDADRNAIAAKHPLVPPEIGCYLSHIAAWQAIAEGDAPGGFVFEDDFAASDDLGVALTHLSAAQDDWDMVKLFSFDPAPKMIATKPLGPFKIGIPYRVPTCLIGYGVTREAARKLAARAIPFFRPVDEDQKFFWETGLRVALVLPQPILVGDQQAETGTIGETRRSTAPGRTGLAGAWHNLKYQLGYETRLRLARFRGQGQ